MDNRTAGSAKQDCCRQLLGSMGQVASSVDNIGLESFRSMVQRELLDTQFWATREQLASAIFE